MNGLVDLVGGSDALGVLADFTATRPELPVLVGVTVAWRGLTDSWEISGQLRSGDVDGVNVWATVLRDAAVTVREYDDPAIGGYTLHEVTGLLRGRLFTFWAHVHHTDAS